MSFIFKYESIFDHAPTRQELASSGYETDEEIRDLKEHLAKSDGVDFWALCFLFKKRGQQNKVDEYFKRAQEEGCPDTFTLGHELAGGCLQFS